MAVHELPFSRRCYADAARAVESRMKTLSETRAERAPGGFLWTIESRIKKPESIQRKVERKIASGRSGYSATAMPDIAGVRVIVDRVSVARALATLLLQQGSMKVREQEDYIAKPRCDGYRGVHLVVEVQSVLPPNPQVPVELQIRTLLQHQWSVLSHSEFYKRVSEIPPSMLMRMRALSEILACAEFESEEVLKSLVLENSSRELSMMRREAAEGLYSDGRGSDGSRSLAIGRTFLHLEEFEQKLRRAILTDGNASDRALSALESLSAVAEVPGGNVALSAKLAGIAERVRDCLKPTIAVDDARDRGPGLP